MTQISQMQDKILQEINPENLWYPWQKKPQNYFFFFLFSPQVL
jgi:hypothetical protein